VSLAKKLRDVVAANFVEIARPEKEAETAKTPHVDAGSDWSTPTIGRLEDDLSDSPENRAAVNAVESDDELAARVGVTTDQLNAVRGVMSATIGSANAAGPSDSAEATLAELSATSDPMNLIADDGSINFDAVFIRTEVPRSSTFTAEQALNMLLSMPSDLPLRVKRLTVKATLDAVGQAVGATPADIVADAERKKGGLNQYIEELEARAEASRIEKEEEMDRLRTLITDIESSIKATTKKKNEAIVATRNRMEQFDQVVAFFAASEPEPVASYEDDDEENEGEMPSFLQDDTVMRLLGINKAENGDEEKATAAAQPAESAV